MNVYLIGDYVRYCTDRNIGYGIFVMEALSGKGYVYSPNADCDTTHHTLRNLHRWLDEEMCISGEDIDVVHWNNGLSDVVRVMGDEPLTPIDLYVCQLRRIHARIRQLFPRAKIIFATTTPVIERKPASRLIWRNEDIRAYNRAAIECLEPLGVVINDLYAVAEQFDPHWYQTCELFAEEGAQALGNAVAGCILRVCPEEQGK